jgi:hypothetical protein
MTKILVAGITEHEVTTAFVGCIATMQQMLTVRPDVTVGFEFFSDVNKALTHFDRAKDADVLVMIDGSMAVDHAFVLNAATDKDFVVAGYALRTLDWARAERKFADPANTERPEFAAAVYNYDTATGTAGGLVDGAASQLYVKNPSIAQAKVCRITRRVLDAIVKRYGDVVRADDGTIVMHAPAIRHGKALNADQAFVELWGGDVYVDITAKTQNLGAMDFVGCVGQRKVLR